jgi:hypothetical protein
MSPIGSTQITLKSFVKFGGGMVKHCGKSMIDEYLSIGITQVSLKGVHLLVPKPNNDPPFYRVDDAIGYFVQWPWKKPLHTIN